MDDLFSTMLYILQMIVVYIFYNYTQALRHCDEDIRTRNIKIMAVPILCMEVAIVTNVLHKQFFIVMNRGSMSMESIFGNIYFYIDLYSCCHYKLLYQSGRISEEWASGDQGIPWSCIGLCYDTDEISICINDRIWVILRDYDFILGTL